MYKPSHQGKPCLPKNDLQLVIADGNPLINNNDYSDLSFNINKYGNGNIVAYLNQETGVFTAPYDGFYRATLNVTFQNNNAGAVSQFDGPCMIRIVPNIAGQGETTFTGSTCFSRLQTDGVQDPFYTNFNIKLTTSGDFLMAKGDTLTSVVYQGNTIGLQIFAFCKISIEKIGDSDPYCKKKFKLADVHAI